MSRLIHIVKGVHVSPVTSVIIRRRVASRIAALVLLVSASAAIRAAVPPWTISGNLTTARASHLAFLLPDGEVLIVGGLATGGAVDSSTDLFDPSTGTWSPGPSTPSAHPQQPAGVRLSDGRILVTGGRFGSDSVESADIYDPPTNTWTATGAMKRGRVGHTLTLLADGRVLAAGGWSTELGFDNTAELYDPVAGTWAFTSSMSNGKWFHTATRLNDGRVLVAGGEHYYDALGPHFRVTQYYNPASGTWTPGPLLHTGRADHEAARLPDGRLIVIGGLHGFAIDAAVASTEIFDGSSWQPGPSMTQGRFHFPLAVMSDGTLLVTGGTTSNGTPQVVTAGAERYDPTTNTWTSSGVMSSPRRFHAALQLANGDVLVSGGQDGSTDLISSEIMGDSRAPLTTATPLFAPNDDGWNNRDVAITLAAADNAGGSGVQSIVYALSGAQTGGDTVGGDTTSVTISAEGTTTLTYHATDAAGNVEAEHTLVVNIDTTTPSFATLPNLTAAATAGGTVVTFSPSASDALSGIVSVTSSPLSSGMRFPAGTTTVQVTAQDAADNTATTSFTVTVVPSPPVVTITGGTFVADGNAHPATAVARDSAGAAVGGSFNIAYAPGGASVPSALGNYSATATFISNDPGILSAFPWTTMAPDPHPKSIPSVAAINSNLYVHGFDQDAAGNQGSFVPRLSIYRPASNTWTIGASPSLVRAFVSAGVINGKLYVAGGCITSDCRIGTTNALEIYDPTTNTWSNGASMPTARFGAAAGVIAGKLYVTGGTMACPPCGVTNATEIYDPATNTWTAGAAIPATRELAMSAVVNGLLYVIGGYERSPGNTLAGAAVGTVSVYNPATTSWSTKSSIPTVRSGAAAGVINGQIYVVGGGGSTYLTANESYDPPSDTWTEQAPMSIARTYVSGGVVNSKLYVIDGNNGNQLTANEAFDPSLTARITIIPPANHAPFANAGGPYFADLGAGVMLNGASSSDLDPGDSILDYAWTIDGTLHLGGANPSLTPAQVNALGAGSHNVSLTVTDTSGATGTASTTLNLQAVLLSISVTPSMATVSPGQNQTFQAIGHFSDGSTQVLPSGNGGGGGGGTQGPNPPRWSLQFVSSQLDVSACATAQYPAPITFAGQGFADMNGTIHETWSAGTPVVTVDGTIDASNVVLTIGCTEGPATGTITAHWTGTRYEGTFSFNGGASAGTVDITGWSPQEPMPAARFSLAAATVGGVVYALGGGNPSLPSPVYAYTPGINTWATVSQMVTPREGAGAAAVNGKIYVVGGHISGGGASGVLEAYDPANNVWITGLTPMPTPRAHLAVVTDGVYLYALGGDTIGTNGGVVATVERYDPSSNSWSTLTPMPSAGNFFVAGVLNGTIVVAGSGGGNSSTTDVYDIASNMWHAGAPMPAGRAMAAAGVANGGLYVFGGTMSGSPAYDTWVYYPATSQRADYWSSVGSMLTARSQLAAAVVGDVVYAIGGFVAGSNPALEFAANEALSTPPMNTFAPGGSFVVGGGGSSSLPTVQWQSTSPSVGGIEGSGTAHANAPGQTTIVASASNGMSCTTSNTCATLTVVDAMPPFLNLPNNMTREATGPSGATVTFFVSANDGVDGQRPVTCNRSSGSTFAFGTTTVTCSASDTSGNTATGSFTITVQDTNAPFLGLPNNQTREATSAAGAMVTYFVSANDSVDGSVPTTCTPASGSQFSFGATTVNCSASDAHGNTRTASFTITVQDTKAPFLNVPTGNQTREATNVAGAVVAYSASANDSVDGARPVTCNPASGSQFPFGSTTVTCSASDTHGNTATRTFTITVRDTTAPTIASAAPSTVSLWPPNHAMVPITVAVSARDVADAAPVCSVASVSSSEPTNGLGDGDTAPDWTVTGALSLNLRAERAGNGSGRVYTITVTCADQTGNTSTTTTVVTVAHDRGK